MYGHEVMDAALVAQEIDTVIRAVDPDSYYRAQEKLAQSYDVLTEDEEFSDFTTSSGVRFRLHRDLDDTVERLFFDLRKDDIDDLDEDDLDELGNEYFEQWQQQTAALTKLLGKPRCANGFGNKGYPEDTEAQWVSLWKLKEARLTLEVHDGHDVIPQHLAAIYRPDNS